MTKNFTTAIAAAFVSLSALGVAHAADPAQASHTELANSEIAQFTSAIGADLAVKAVFEIPTPKDTFFLANAPLHGGPAKLASIELKDQNANLNITAFQVAALQ